MLFFMSYHLTFSLRGDFVVPQRFSIPNGVFNFAFLDILVLEFLALWLHHPDDPAAVGRGDEYLWGRDILVAPVAEKGAISRKLYLPRGQWYDFWTGVKVDGGREISRPVDLATMPIYVRAGAILPPPWKSFPVAESLFWAVKQARIAQKAFHKPIRAI